MEELHEAVATLDDVQGLLDELVVSGLRSAPPGTLARLGAQQEEFVKIGAAHLGDQLARLIESISADSRDAAEHLVRLQTSLRLFERVLSLEAAASSLEYLQGLQDDSDEAGDAPS